MTDIIIPYTPRPLQEYLHDNLKRFSVIVCHRRFGKSVFAINELIKSVVECPLEMPRVAYVGPTYSQTKRIIWDYAKKYVSPIPNVKINNSDLSIDFPNEGRLELMSADRPERLRGLYLDAVILDEFAEMSPIIWSQVIRPALADRNGKAIFIGTPKGQNAFYRIYQNAKEHPDIWFSKMYKASDTNILNESELRDVKVDMSDDEYEQEFECSWSAAIKGAYYANALEKIDKQIRKVDLYPDIAVSTAWDIGVSDMTTIWFFQRVGTEIHIIDFYQNHGEGIQHYVKVLQDKGYTYGIHYGPHDLKVREFGNNGKSRVEVAKQLGLNFKVLEASNVNDGIEIARNIIARCYFDRIKCKEGLDALRNYHQVWNDKNQIFSNHPEHDWSSHAADAFRYLAMGIPNTISRNSTADYYRRINKKRGATVWAN